MVSRRLQANALIERHSFTKEPITNEKRPFRNRLDPSLSVALIGHISPEALCVNASTRKAQSIGSDRYFYFRRKARHGSRVGNAPMGRHWVPRPYWADFTGRVIADGEDEVEFGSVWCREFIPGLASQTANRDMRGLQLPQGFRTHRS